MRRFLLHTVVGACLCLWLGGHAEGRGFGGFRAGGFGGYGGFRAGGVAGFRGGELGSYSAARSFGGVAGFRGGAIGGTYDRNRTGARGGSINVEGARGAVRGPLGGVAAGGGREVTATGPGGRTYSAGRAGGVAVGPYGRTVGGVAGRESFAGPRGWESAYHGTRFATDAGLAHYGGVALGGIHPTAYWSRADMGIRASYVRNGFGYYHCFRPGWFRRYPGCWSIPGWALGYAWTYPTWVGLYPYLGFIATPYTYDYGNDIVYQGDTVYVGWQPAGTPAQYAQQAITLADAGVQANAAPQGDWKPLGVFALVQGDEKTSNNLFQLAVNKDGIIRGNYYEGLTDTTTPVYGSINKKTQRAAWTVGKSKDRVFEAGVYNLTQPEAPCLLHVGTDRTQQLLLVRMDPPTDAQAGGE